MKKILFFLFVFLPLPSQSSEVYLTFDLCDKHLNYEVYDYLVKNKINATIFISGLWLKANPDKIDLFKKENFRIANHGHTHSSAGPSIYPQVHQSKDLTQEIVLQEKKLKSLYPDNFVYYYRSAAAVYNDHSKKTISSLGYKIADYDFSDYGFKISPLQFINQIKPSKNNLDHKIILIHLNNASRPDLNKAILSSLEDIQKQANFSFLP